MKTISKFIGLSKPVIIIITLFLLVATLLLGIEGLFVILGFYLLTLPVVMFLQLVDLPMGEKVLFSIFLGLGFTSSIVYYPGIYISLWASYYLTIFILFGCLVLFLFIKNKTKEVNKK